MTKARNIANIASDGSALADGTINYTDVSGTPTLATVATSGSFNDLSNQPAAFDPNTLAAVAVSGAYADVTGTPTLATVATTGAYADVTGTPAAALPLTGGTLSGTLTLNGALNGVTSVNATTAAAITAAGVGGGDEWIELSNTAEVNFTLTGNYTSGLIDLSSALSGMPNDFKYFLIQCKITMTAPTTPSDYYAYGQGGTDIFRIGYSSTNYHELTSTIFSGQNNFIGLSGSSIPGPIHYNALLISSPLALASRSPTFVYDTVSATYTTRNKVQANSFLPALKTPAAVGYPQGPYPYTGGTDINYLAWKISGVSYSSNTDEAPTLKIQFKVAYVGV